MGISDRGNSCPWVLKHFRQKWNQLSLQNRDNPEKTGAADAGGAPSGDRRGLPRRRLAADSATTARICQGVRPQRQFHYLSML
jgi:hypothetical protein